MNGLVIEARGLEKRFGPVTALAGVDLAVPHGAALALLGPNGAGKTTLLRLLAGVAQPTAGSLRVGTGSQERRHRRGRIGFVGHATRIYPTLTVRENLLFAARLYGVADPPGRSEELLERHGLAPIADRPAAVCSRGMAQRLSVARGLVHDPQIVLLDEPFTGLDGPAAKRLVAVLRRLRSAERTLIVATHDLSRAAELADTALILGRGEVVYRSATPPLSLDELEESYARAAGAAP